MANMQYIGARYVPTFYENPDDNSNDWKLGVSYEPLTVVTYLDDSYTSKIAVPASVGDPASNPTYWVKTGNYNASITQIQNELTTHDNAINNIKKYYINALDIGFKNDGAADNSTLFNTVFSDDNYDGATIYFPSGVYILSAGVTITKKIKIYGDPGTIFRCTANSGYVFTYNFTDYSYLDRRCGILMSGVTIDCNNTNNGIALISYLDIAFEDITIDDPYEYGMNTVPEGTRTGAQLSVTNAKFYSTNYSNNATAIYDWTGDSQYSNIIVVGLKTAFYGSGMIDRLHHWLLNSVTYSGSCTLKVNGGMYTNIYCDTVEALLTPTSGATTEGNIIEIVNMTIYNNNSVNTNDSYLIKFNSSPHANISLKNVSIRYDKCHAYDLLPSSTMVDGFSSAADPSLYTHFRGGQFNTPNTSNAFVYAGAGQSVNSIYNSGLYWIDSAHPITDLPGGTISGVLIVKQSGYNRALQIVLYNNGNVYYRTLQQTPTNWRQIATTPI